MRNKGPATRKAGCQSASFNLHRKSHGPCWQSLHYCHNIGLWECPSQYAVVLACAHELRHKKLVSHVHACVQKFVLGIPGASLCLRSHSTQSLAEVLTQRESYCNLSCAATLMIALCQLQPVRCT